MKKVLFNWSGGKDSSLSLYQLLEDGNYDVCGLLTSANKKKPRFNAWDPRRADSGSGSESWNSVALFTIAETRGYEGYNRLMLDTLRPFKERGIHHCTFGDIFLEDLRTYREEKLKEVDMEAIFPLWKISTEKLAEEFIDLGFKAIISSVDGSKLDASFVGREYNLQFLKDLPEEVDPCGENGEFHSFVYDGPIFENPVSVKRGEVVEKTYDASKDSRHSFSDKSNGMSSFSYWFIDLLPD